MDTGTPGDEDPQPNEAGFEVDDAVAISTYLFARDEVTNATAWPNAQAAITRIFPDEAWGTFQRPSLFVEKTSKPNLYRAEIPGEFKRWLQAQGIDEIEYASHIPDVQFNTVDIWPKRLFGDGYKHDRGWRIQMLGFPAMEIVALGLAHATQGEQAQDRLGTASSMLREAALRVLAVDTGLKSTLESYPSATSHHWNDKGLIPAPVKYLGQLDISGYEPGARLKFIRNTSAKRQIACHFALVGMTGSQFHSDAYGHLRNFRDVAVKLGEVGTA